MEGNHSVQVNVADVLGNAATSSWPFRTATAPTVVDQEPKGIVLLAADLRTIRARVSDVGAGVDRGSVRMSWNDVDVTAGATIQDGVVEYRVPTPPAPGKQTIRVVASDASGNTVESSWTFLLIGSEADLVFPDVGAVTPARSSTVQLGSPIVVSALFNDRGAGVDASKTKLFVNGVDVTAEATSSAAGISYQPAQPFAVGPVLVNVQFTTLNNNVGSDIWAFRVEEPPFYSLLIVEPAGPVSTSESQFRVVVEAGSNQSGITRITLDGEDMAALAPSGDSRWRFSGDAVLQDGLNTLRIAATFADGTTRTDSRQVSYNAPARVVITSPADRAILGRASVASPGDLTGSVERPVTVSGRTTKAVSSVTVNQQAATLSNGGDKIASFRISSCARERTSSPRLRSMRWVVSAPPR